MRKSGPHRDDSLLDRDARTLPETARWLLAAALGIVACSAPGGFHPRRVTLASPEPSIDRGFALARRSAFDGDLERADATLRAMIQGRPNDPLVPAMRLFHARVLVAQGNLVAAEQIARTTSVDSDPALTFDRDLVRGIIAAREGRDAIALILLRPLEGRLPDRSETSELSCALAEAESRSGDAAHALHAFMVLERAVQEGVSWLSTELSCEEPTERAALLERTLSRANDPQALADTLDGLPADSTARRPIATRLRDIARASNQIARWRQWLADAPDDPDTATPIVASQGPLPLAIGVMAPMTGARTSVGLSIVRGVQYGIEGAPNVRLVTEDEGSSPTDATEALERLHAAGARIVIGVSREDLSAAVAIRAQSLGVDLWMIAPLRGVAGTGARIHAAGPTLEDRAVALLAAIRARHHHALVVRHPDAMEALRQLRERASAEGVTLSTRDVDAPLPTIATPAAGSVVVLGLFAHETQMSLASSARRAPSRWIFEARTAEPGTDATLVGARGGPGLAAFVSAHCHRVGAPPDELTLLGYDAGRAAIAHARSTAAPPPALAPGWPLTYAIVHADGRVEDGEAPAAAARCSASTP